MNTGLVACVLAVAAFFAATPARAEVLGDAQGVWELDPAMGAARKEFTCAARPLEIRIDPEAMVYESRRGDDAEWAVADILRVRSHSFLIIYRGEARLDSEGAPVEWWLDLSDDGESFVWKRNDWPLGARTDARRRCKADLTS